MERGGRIESAEDDTGPARQQGAGGETDGDRVVHGRADQVHVARAEVPQLGLVGEGGGRSVLVPQARPHALGPTGGARRVVHGPSQRVGRQVHGWAPVQGGEPGHVGDDERRPGVGHQRLPLRGDQGGVEEHRNHAGAQGAQNGTQQPGRGGQAEGDPVPGTEAGCGQRPGGTPLSNLRLLGGRQLDVGAIGQLDDGAIGHASSSGTGTGRASAPGVRSSNAAIMPGRSERAATRTTSRMAAPPTVTARSPRWLARAPWTTAPIG